MHRKGFSVAAVALALLWTFTAAQAAEVRNIFDVRVPMRDGVELSADIWLPSSPGKYPAILMRTPYIKARARPGRGLRKFIAAFADSGYAAIYQDVRGRGDSDGVLFAGGEAEDGHDTIEWIAGQPWSNGKVCTMGVSYLAAVQWAAASQGPPHLKCMAATATGSFHRAFSVGGAPSPNIFHWLNSTSGHMMQPPLGRPAELAETMSRRPLLNLDEALGRSMPNARKWLTMNDPNYDPIVGRRFSAEDFRLIDLPVLHVTGWFDIAQPSVLDFWHGMAAHSRAKDRQYLLIGPWDHVQTMIGGEMSMGEMTFTAEAMVDTADLHARFYAHYLKGTAKSFDFPRARVYVTGTNRWRDFNSYPPRESGERKLYLHSGGGANSLAGDGRLDWSESGDESPDSFVYDPRDPVPYYVGGMPGTASAATDQQGVEARADVLVYTGEVLDQALEIIGPVSVELYAVTDGRDTDFTAKLLDVYADGRAVQLGSPATGVIRARYRNGIGREDLLTPGKIEKYVISLADVGHTFLPGHRIRVEISSSAYPLIFPNQNTGNPIATDTEWRVAQQTVYHDRNHPSALILPVFSDGGGLSGE